MKLKNLKKIAIWLVGALTLTATTSMPIAKVAAWGPENRPTYTNNSPADYATFNSITNNAAVGDERNFVRIREAGTDQNFGDEITIVPGHEYEVWIYYHNNAATDTNASGYGVATNTRVSSAYPTVVNTNERGMVSGIISWSYVTPADPNNAKEATVWDEAYVTSNTDGVVLRYKTGTAVIHNSGAVNGSVLPDDLFTEEGTPIGFNKLSGTLPGCAEYSGHITYTLVAEQTESTMEKLVSLDGENWSNSVSAKPGDFVTYKVVFKNTGNTNFTNVIFKDTHDNDLLVRSGSTKVYDVDNVDGKVIDDILDISGYNVGDVRAGALVQIIYQMQVREDLNLDNCERSLQNTISVAYNGEDQKESTTTVIVTKEDCTPPPTPEDCNTNPNLPGCDLPKEIVQTGPLQIVMAVLVVLGIGAGGFYLYRTRRTLKTVESTITGGSNNGINPFDSSEPTEPTDPITPASPSTPEQPAEPEAPATPQTPSEPVAPASFSAPTNPIAPKESEQPAQPEQPQEPQTPETPSEN